MTEADHRLISQEIQILRGTTSAMAVREDVVGLGTLKLGEGASAGATFRTAITVG